MMKILEKARSVMLDVLFPVICFGCGKEGKYICEKCEGFVGEAAFICPVCQQPSFTGERHENCLSRYGLDGLVGIWEYEGFVKKFIAQIKYQGATHAIQEIGERVFRVMTQNIPIATPFLSFLLSEDTYITYVPMAKSKEKKRGFNQAACLAREIGNITKKEILPLLQKIKDTPSQTELDKEQRLQNVKDSFEFKSEIRSTTQSSDGSPHRMIGAKSETNSKFQIPKSVVLVDDVWTTGATLKECCKVLKRSGVQHVWGFVLARTV